MDPYNQILEIVSDCLTKPFKHTFKSLLKDRFFRQDAINAVNQTILIDGELIIDEERLGALLDIIIKLLLAKLLEISVHNGDVEVLVGPDGNFRYRWID